MATGRVAKLWRYPVSSLGGEPMRELAVRPDGVDGDRLFGLIHKATEEIARPDRGPQWHAVPRIMARLVGRQKLQIATPDSDWIDAPSADADLAASAFLGFEAAVLAFDGTSADEPGFKSRYDKSPIHLLTTASMARLKSLHPEGNPDPRRFRPNILVDLPPTDGSFPETEWIGRRLEIGELGLTIAEPCRRCGFTIIAQDGFDHDPGILRNLVRHNTHNMGVYCTVNRPGKVEIGDEMRLV